MKKKMDGVIKFGLSRPRQAETEQEAHYQSLLSAVRKEKEERETRQGKKWRQKEVLSVAIG